MKLMEAHFCQCNGEKKDHVHQYNEKFDKIK